MTNIGEEVGFDFKWREFTCRRTYFNNNLDNFIDFVTVCNTNAACAAPFITAAGLSPSFTTVRQYNNVGSATFQGFEIIGGWQPLTELQARTRASPTPAAYLTSSNYPTLERTGVQLGQVPNWMFTAGAEWRPIAGAGLHRHPEVVPGLLERHGPYPVERRRDPDRPRRDLFARQGRRHLWQHPEPYQRPVSGDGLYLDVVRRPDGQRDVHPGTGMPLTAIVGLRARF